MATPGLLGKGMGRADQRTVWRGGLTCLTFEAAAHPPFRAGFDADPPEKTFKHFEGVRNTETTGGIGVACVHDPRSCQKGHIDANGNIEGEPAEAAVVSAELEAIGTGLWTSNVVPWSSWIKRPLAARSSMSGESGRRCEGIWSHSEVRRWGWCWADRGATTRGGRGA